MAEQIGRQWSDDRYKQGELVRLSLADFTVRVHQCVVELMQVRDHVQHVYEVFSDQGDIWSDECDNLLVSLHTMNAALRDLRKLFEAKDSLPLVIISLRHQLIADLCTAEEHVHRLVYLARTFRSMCRLASSQAVKLHYGIILELEALLQVGEDIRCDVQFIFDQTRFLERRQAL